MSRRFVKITSCCDKELELFVNPSDVSGSNDSSFPSLYRYNKPTDAPFIEGQCYLFEETDDVAPGTPASSLLERIDLDDFIFGNNITDCDDKEFECDECPEVIYFIFRSCCDEEFELIVSSIDERLDGVSGIFQYVGEEEEYFINGQCYEFLQMSEDFRAEPIRSENLNENLNETLNVSVDLQIDSDYFIDNFLGPFSLCDECGTCPDIRTVRINSCCDQNFELIVELEFISTPPILEGVFHGDGLYEYTGTQSPLINGQCYNFGMVDSREATDVINISDFNYLPNNNCEYIVDDLRNNYVCYPCDGCFISISNGSYTSNINYFNYIGWFFKINNEVTNYYIESVVPDGFNFIINIFDKETGYPASNFNPCSDFCLVKLKPKIEVSDEFIEIINIGAPLEINSDCFENNQFFVNSINGNEITVYSEEYSDLCVNGSFITDEIGEEFIIDSNYINSGTYSFNNNLYYLSIQFYSSLTFYLYILFDGDVWVHYFSTSILDLSEIEGISYQDWTSDGSVISISQNLINNEWLSNLNNSQLSTEYCDFDISDDCQGEICINFNSQLLQNKWVIIDDWKMDKTYNEGDIVIFDDILYQANTQSNIEDPTVIINGNQIKSGPFNSSEWNIYTDNYNYSIFWNPDKSISGGYTTSNDFFNNVVYNNDDFYEYVGGSEDFWNPVTAMSSGYNLGDTVYYKGKYYYSMTSSNHYTIDYTVGFENDITISWRNRNNILFMPWVATHSTSPAWERIELWNPSLPYGNGDYVVHKNMVWIATNNVEPGEEPDISTLWDFKYDILPKIGFNYSETNNKIIFMNNKYYLSTSLIGVQLDNGIIIYINKKWKNIFINININDDTLPNISNSDRDLLYNEIYSNITANNFIQAINDISNKYGFANYLKYVVIEEDGTITEHSFDKDITKLKHIITAEYPDKFEIRVDSLDKKVLRNPRTLNATRKLKNSEIDLEKLNWYNGSPLSFTIEDNLSEVPVVINFHNLKNITNLDFYRFSGYYMPIFYDIELFKKAEDFEELGNWIFDDSLTDFGILKERKIKKVNRRGSMLRLINDDNNRSIYPMLDEFGYTTNDFFIFKSNWDFNYYLESSFTSLNFETNIIRPIPVDNIDFGKTFKVVNKKFNI